MFKYIVALFAFSLISASAQAESLIKTGMTEFTVKLNGETCKIGRNQTPGNTIHELYASTHRGKPMPITLAPGIETLGELEFIEYMQRAQNDPSIVIVDTRTEGWHHNLRIPCTVNVPFTLLNDDEFVALSTVVETFGVVENDDETLDFSKAKTIVGYCNGFWCGQTPGMFVNAKYSLKNIGYPVEKLKYYRGGMQAWTALGMDVVGAKK